MGLRFGARIGGAGAAATLGLAAGTASASAVEVRLTGVDEARGTILVAVCTEETFLGRSCPYAVTVPARAGEMLVTVEGVPPGVYAAQAVHDANDNMELDRNFVGWPLEGLGFSNDAPIRMGPPSYEDARFEVGPEGASLTFRMRYY